MPVREPHGKRAPEQIQEIVKAVLERNAMRSIRLGPPSEYNRAEEMADGRLAIPTVRQFLLDFWTDLETANPSPGCREHFDHLCEMKPEIGPGRRMYVKFGLDIDSDNYAASHITIVRFHPAIDSRPIDRIPEIE
jgi:hypothetical protein